MISQKNLQNIQSLKNNKVVNTLLPFIIFITCFIICYYLNLVYDNNSSLVNDKLIDVSSIFFGVFLGCLYLFERFKNNATYQQFLKFCKRLLYLNIIIITLSFIVILINDDVPNLKSITLGKQTYKINLKSLLFSFYLSLFAVTLYSIWRFIKIILLILKTGK